MKNPKNKVPKYLPQFSNDCFSLGLHWLYVSLFHIGTFFGWCSVKVLMNEKHPRTFIIQSLSYNIFYAYTYTWTVFNVIVLIVWVICNLCHNQRESVSWVGKVDKSTRIKIQARQVCIFRGIHANTESIWLQ